MKKRWITLYVENDVGVLAKVAGLFSAKSYNLEGLTVGTTEDSSISKITISLTSDDATFEQIKKQLNRCVEVIKVVDLTNVPVHIKEVLYLKIKGCSREDKAEIVRISKIFNINIIDYGVDSILLESLQTETKNNDIIKFINDNFKQLEIIRSGSIAVEAINITER